MSTTQSKEQQVGQLIAEIMRFGGHSKEEASRLARILLPIIHQHTLEARLIELDLLEQFTNRTKTVTKRELNQYKMERLGRLTELHDNAKKISKSMRNNVSESQKKNTSSKGDEHA